MASQTDGYHGSTEFSLGLSLLYHLSVALSNGKDLDAITETYSGSEPLMLAWAQASKTKTALGDKLEKIGLKLLKDLMKKPGDPTLKTTIGQCEQMGSPALKQLAFVCKTLNNPPAILDGTLAAEGPALALAFKAYVQLQPLDPEHFLNLGGAEALTKVTTFMAEFEQQLSAFAASLPETTAELTIAFEPLQSLAQSLKHVLHQQTD